MPQMPSQKPRADGDGVCPLHRRPQQEVCHRCPLWTQVRGKHPQSDAGIDWWDCSLAWLPVLLIENSQQQRQTGAAVESFRNEMVRAQEVTLQMFREQDGPVRLIDGGGR